MTDDDFKPVTTPDPGMEICYECRGKRRCWACDGRGRMNDDSLCLTCGGGRVCAVCSGNGQLPLGTDAATD
jgi:hypothetical protein